MWKSGVTKCASRVGLGLGVSRKIFGYQIFEIASDTNLYGASTEVDFRRMISPWDDGACLED